MVLNDGRIELFFQERSEDLQRQTCPQRSSLPATALFKCHLAPRKLITKSLPPLTHIYISIHEPHTHAIRTLPPPPYPMGVVCSCTVCMYNPSTLDSLRLFSNILAQAHSVAHTSLVSLSLSLPLAPVQHRHGNAESPSILCELCDREGVRERGFRKCHPGSKVITRPPEERKTGR